MKIFSYINLAVWLLVGIVIAALCVANRSLVVVSLDPVSRSPLAAFEAPLYLVLIIMLAAGLLLGSFVTWLRQSRHRFAARAAKREVARLSDELEKLEKESREKVAKAAQDGLISGAKGAEAQNGAIAGENVQLLSPAGQA